MNGQPGGNDAPVNPSERNASEAPSRPGERLMAERRAQGLSLGDVARQLKLSVRQVEALERDQYDAFPGHVFVRGFLRNYAKLLQLDPEEVVARAGISWPGAAAPLAPAPALAPVPFQEADSGRRSRIGIGTLATGAVVLALVIAALYEARNEPPPVSLAPPAPSGTLTTPSLQHAESPSGTVADGGVPSAALPRADTASTSTSPAPAAAPAPDASPEAARPAAPAPGEPSGPAEVRMAFEEESWVEIKDRDGAVIFSRLNSSGSEQVVSGEPPLTLVIGNAHAVRLSYRNKPVDLAPHMRVDVARLTLE